MRSRVRARRAPRPHAPLRCRRIAADMARKLPELGHVKPSRILFVAGEARRGARATIRPLAQGARGSVKGGGALYCVTLWHDVLHSSAQCDARLPAERHDAGMPKGRFEALLRPLVRSYLAAADTA